MPQIPLSEIIKRTEQLTKLIKQYLHEHFPNESFEKMENEIILSNPSLEKIQIDHDYHINNELEKRYITITCWRIALTYIILLRRALENKVPEQEIKMLLYRANFYLKLQKEEAFRVDMLNQQDNFKKEFLPKFGSDAKTIRYQLIQQKVRELLLEAQPPRQWQYATDAARSIKAQILEYDKSLSEEANRPNLEKVPYTTSTKMQLKDSNTVRLISKYINQDEDLKQKIIKSRTRK